MEIELEQNAMFARRPKRYLRKVRNKAIEAAMEDKGMTRQQAERACATVTDEQILGFSFQAGITAAEMEGDEGSWWDWLKDKFSKIDWLKVGQVVLQILSVMVLFLGNEAKAKPCDTGDVD